MGTLLPGMGPACGCVVTSMGTAGPDSTDVRGAVPLGVSTRAVTRGAPGRPLMTLLASLAAALSISSCPNVLCASGAKWFCTSARRHVSGSSPGYLHHNK